MDESEFEKKIKAAYAPPPAPDALRERLRAIGGPADRRPVVKRVALGLVAASVLALGIGVVRIKGAGGTAAAMPPEPGQLVLKAIKGAERGTCPLHRTDVDARIDGVISTVRVTQMFVAPDGEEPLEAVYSFPLPENAAVQAMEMRIGKNRIVRAVLKRRAAARKTYEAAKSQGKTAALLDQERPNVFTQSVANLLPGEPVEVTLTYTALVPFKSGRYEFAFPMTVGPRYSPNTGKTMLPWQSATAPTRSGHDIGLRVTVNGGLPLTNLASSQHAVRIEAPDASHAQVSLAPGESIPNRDFILRYALSGQEVQEGLLCHADPDGSGRGSFLLMLQPPAAPAPEAIAPREVVFVIDQTGSQSGAPIEVSKKIISACLKQLRPGDTFQILGFNTDVFPCFAQPLPATPENLERAEAFLNPIQGDGGTDILKSIETALAIPADPERLRLVCYFTDGFVDNEDAIFSAIDRGGVRLFPFGVGSSVNRWLIEGMARVGRGQSEVVPLDSRADALAGRFAERLADPVLTDLQLQGRSIAELHPRRLPDVFSAAPLVAVGRYTQAGPSTITLSGRLGGKPWSRQVAVTFPAKTRGTGAIQTLWAREKIAELSFEKARGNDREEEITRLALAHRLMSEYTSFVAVEERLPAEGGKPRPVTVSQTLTEGMEEPPASTGSVVAPEPGSALLALTGLLGLGIVFRRRLAAINPAAIEELS